MSERRPIEGAFPIVLVTRVMLALNAAFWLFVGAATAAGLTDFGLDSGAALVIGALAVGNGIVLALAAWRVLRGSRLVDLVALILVAVNGVLSVTDQMNPADWAALMWNAVIFGLLVAAMRDAAGRGDDVKDEEAPG